MLTKQLKPRTLQNRRSHGNNRLAKRLNIAILRVIELATSVTVRPRVGQLLPTLKSNLEVALAPLVEKLVTMNSFKHSVCKLFAQLDIAVHRDRLDHLKRCGNGCPSV